MKYQVNPRDVKEPSYVFPSAAGAIEYSRRYLHKQGVEITPERCFPHRIVLGVASSTEAELEAAMAAFLASNYAPKADPPDARDLRIKELEEALEVERAVSLYLISEVPLDVAPEVHIEQARVYVKDYVLPRKKAT